MSLIPATLKPSKKDAPSNDYLIPAYKATLLNHGITHLSKLLAL
jgi:hypothetical protein